MDNERTLRELIVNLQTITSQLEGFTQTGTIPPELELRIEKLKSYVFRISGYFSEIKEILDDFTPRKRSKLQEMALRETVAADLKEVTQKIHDALFKFNVGFSNFKRLSLN